MNCSACLDCDVATVFGPVTPFFLSSTRSSNPTPLSSNFLALYLFILPSPPPTPPTTINTIYTITITNSTTVTITCITTNHCRHHNHPHRHHYTQLMQINKNFSFQVSLFLLFPSTSCYLNYIIVKIVFFSCI